jgi:GrpB-like predicted nucleotidyltransferase (UPF0157 family)
MASDPVEIVPYTPEWPRLFARLAEDLRGALGPVALRIDHVGSTAVPGLAAKPIIDIQISVANFEPLDAYRAPLASLGYTFRADNPERTKRYFREPRGSRRTHLHVRRAGSFSEQASLLFRDYLRAHGQARMEYAAVKQAAAARYPDAREQYSAAKAPVIWEMLRLADAWAQASGWTPGTSDG